MSISTLDKLSFLGKNQLHNYVWKPEPSNSSMTQTTLEGQSTTHIRTSTEGITGDTVARTKEESTS